MSLCRKCNETYVLRDGEDETGFCDNCAQEMIADLVDTLGWIARHQGFDQNNCAMDEREWRTQLQEGADLTLRKFGLLDELGEDPKDM